MTETQQQTVAATVQRLRERVRQIRQRRDAITEQDTKVAFINPLLTALGWNLEEMDEVRSEYRRKPQDNLVDYALLLLRSPCLFVEAKALSADLSDRKWIAQTLGYSTVVGVEWWVLTNREEYRLYNAHAPVDAEEKLFRTVSLSDVTRHDYLVETLELLSKDKMGENRLNLLWKAHFVDRRVQAHLEEKGYKSCNIPVCVLSKNSERWVLLLAENVFWVPKEARWSYLQDNAKQPTIGKLVDDAMVAIERDNHSLKGVLPKEYARPGLDKQRLGELIDLIGTIGLGDEEHRAKDILGRVYEYSLSQFASAEGKKGTES